MEKNMNDYVSVEAVMDWIFDNFSETEHTHDTLIGRRWTEVNGAFNTMDELCESFYKMVEESKNEDKNI